MCSMKLRPVELAPLALVQMAKTVMDRVLGKVNASFTIQDSDSNYVSAERPSMNLWALAKLFIEKSVIL